MKKLIYIILLSVCFTGVLLSEPNKQLIIEADSPIYDYIEILNLESGNTNIILSRPSSVAELQLFLSTIDSNKLSKQGLNLYRRLEETLKNLVKEHEWVIYEPSVEINTETYVQTNNETNWLYDYSQRQPLLNSPNTIYLLNNFLFHAEIDVAKDPYVTNLDNNYTNILTDMNHLSSLFPHRAYVTAGGDNWNFSISKDQNNWGNGQFSNFMISDVAPYHDTIKTSFFDQYSKTSFLLMSMSPHFVDSAGEYQTFGDDAGEYPGKYLLAHRTEVSLFDAVRLSLNEGLLVFNTPLDLRFFNPANMYHNFFLSENATSFIQIDMNIRLLQYWDFYYQIGFNQIQTPFESERYVGANDIPGGMGHILGVRANYPVAEGYLRGCYEFTYTSPWMYINSWDPTKNTPSLNYNWSAIVLSNYRGTRDPIFTPLGHAAGNDSIVHFFTLDYVVPFQWEAGLECLLHFNGENTLLTIQERGPEAVMESAASGTVETILALTLKGKVQIFDELGIYSQGTIVSITNQGNLQSNDYIDFQFVLGINYTPDFK